MDEVVDLLNEILDELRTMNEKLDDIRGNEYDDGSLEDIFSKLDDIDDSINNLGWILWYHISNDISFQISFNFRIWHYLI